MHWNYNMLIECFSDILSKTCNDETKQNTDFNDDGSVTNLITIFSYAKLVSRMVI